MNKPMPTIKLPPHNLTKLEKDFADKVLDGGGSTRSMQELTGTSYMVAAVKASNMMKNERVVRYLTNQSKGAASRIVVLSKKAENETVRLNANKDILDRANVGTRPTTVVATQVNIGKDREEFLTQQ